MTLDAAAPDRTVLGRTVPGRTVPDVSPTTPVRPLDPAGR